MGAHERRTDHSILAWASCTSCITAIFFRSQSGDCGGNASHVEPGTARPAAVLAPHPMRPGDQYVTQVRAEETLGPPAPAPPLAPDGGAAALREGVRAIPALPGPGGGEPGGGERRHGVIRRLLRAGSYGDGVSLCVLWNEFTPGLNQCGYHDFANFFKKFISAYNLEVFLAFFWGCFQRAEKIFLPKNPQKIISHRSYVLFFC